MGRFPGAHNGRSFREPVVRGAEGAVTASPLVVVARRTYGPYRKSVAV